MQYNELWQRPAASASLASGSSGNVIYFQSGRTKLLIDAGISAKRIREALALFSVSPEELSAVFVTHEHSDHISGLEVLARRYALPVFMSAGTYREWSGRVPRAAEIDVRLVADGDCVALDELSVRAFSTPHDAAESLGYVVDDGRRRMAVFTDLGRVEPGLLEAVRGVDLAYVEANYDPTMLWAGPYPWPLKQRIAGARGHLSNDEAGEAIFAMLNGGSEHFVLAHLSAENNMPSLADLTIQQLLAERGVKVGEDLRLRLAPRHEPGPLLPL